jgi:hypothetical protein
VANVDRLYNRVTLTFDGFAHAVMAEGIVIENIIVDQENRKLLVWYSREEDKPEEIGWELGGLLRDALSHLRCAAAIPLRADDQIVADHVRQAYALLDSARLKAAKEESNRDSASTRHLSRMTISDYIDEFGCKCEGCGHILIDIAVAEGGENHAFTNSSLESELAVCAHCYQSDAEADKA